MTAAVKMDEWSHGKSDFALDVVCWTPRFPDDTLAQAGERLLRAFLYNMDNVEEGKTQSTDYLDVLWQEDGWNPSVRLERIFEEVRGGGSQM